MAFSNLLHTVYQWFNAPSDQTPLDATHLEAAEQSEDTYIQQDVSALDTYLEGILAPLASPAFTGTPTAPTPPNGDNSTRLATTAYVQTNSGGTAGVTSFNGRTGPITPTAGDYLVSQITGAAPLASPALTGTPTAPTAAALTDNTQVATTAYADSAVAVETSRAEAAEALLAPLNSPALTGSPTAPTQVTTDNTTKLATTAFVKNFIGAGASTPVGANVITNSAYGATCNGKILTDGAMSLNSATLTSAGPFVSGDAGKSIRVAGAGNAAGTQDLVTTIATYVSSSQVTLNANCLNSSGVSGATVYYGNLDTSAVNTAAATPGAYVKAPPGSTVVLDTIAPFQGVLDLTGCTVLQIQGLGQAVVSDNLSSEPATTISRMVIVGGYWPGTGNEKQNQQPVVVANVQDLVIKDMICVGNASGVVYVGDFQRVRCINCTGIATNNRSGYNLFTFTDLLHGNAADASNDLFVYGCYASAPGVAGVCFNSSNGYTATSVNFVLALNDCTSASTLFGPIVVEIGGNATTKLQYGLVIGNVCTQTATTSGAYGIIVTNDGSPTTSPADCLQSIVIAMNVINSGRSGIQSQGDRVLIASNLVNAGTGNGIYCADHNSSGISHNHVTGNIIHMGATSVGYALWFSSMHASQSIGNDIYYDASPTGANPAVFFQNCTDCHSISDSIRGCPAQAWQISGSTDCTVRNGYAFNIGSRGVATSALLVNGTGTGNHVVMNNYFYATNGFMQYAVNNTGTGATCNRAGNVQIGATSAPTSGTWATPTTF